MMRYILALICLIASPASADVTMSEIMTRAVCVEFRTAVVEHRLDGEYQRHPHTWTGTKNDYHAALESLAVFEETHLRPFLDKESQETIYTDLFPNGAPIGSEVRDVLSQTCHPFIFKAFLRSPNLDRWQEDLAVTDTILAAAE